MLVDQQRSGVRAGAFRKVLHLLESLVKTLPGEVIYMHVEQMLDEQDIAQTEKERALCGLLRLVLDAFSTHLKHDSALFMQIKLLQLRLSPPLSQAELSALQHYMEMAADQITQLDSLRSETIESGLAPLLTAFGFERESRAPHPAIVKDRRNEIRRALDERREDNVHYLQQKNGNNGHKNGAPTVNGKLDEESAVSPLFRMEISDTIAKSEEFGALLEIELATLSKLENIDEFEEKKTAVIKELEHILKGHRQLTGQFDKVANYLSVIQHDSDRLNAELSRVTQLSLTDELTGLPNRRAFIHRLNEEVSRVQRYGHTLALAIIDLDSFKPINDTFGHQAGDAVLYTYAREVLSSFRQHDMVARYGGEEFAVIFPNAEQEGALRALKKVQQLASETTCELELSAIDLPTFSAGLALYQKGEAMESLIKRADGALYRAKDEGRNKIIVA